MPTLETNGAVLPPAGILAARPQVWLAFLAAGCAMLILLPVIAARSPPLTDYPNHLARSYILLNLPHSAVLRRYYRNAMQAQPNLAMDLIIPPLAQLVSIWTAGRIFIGMTVLAMAGGCILLHRALHRRWSSWPVLGFLFVYNRLFLWGFLGYLFALGAALAAAGRISWGGAARKFTAPFNVIYAYHLKLDVAMLAVIGLVVLVLLIKRRVAVARVAYIPLGLLAALMFVMPNELFSSYGADRRIPIALALFAVAASDWEFAPARLRQLCLTGFSLLLALRIALIWQVWAQVQPVYRGLISAFRQLPEGAKLVSAAPALGGGLPTPPLFHVDAYAVILRDVFLPSMFTAPWNAGSSLGFTPPYAKLKQNTPAVTIWPGTLARLHDPAFVASHGPFRPEMIKDYNAGLEIHGSWIPRPARLPTACKVIAKGQDFILVRFPCPT